MINLKLMNDDEKAKRLWELAHHVSESNRIKNFTANNLAFWEFEEWETLIRSFAKEKLNWDTTHEDESAVTAIVIAYRYGLEMGITNKPNKVQRLLSWSAVAIAQILIIVLGFAILDAWGVIK